MNRSEHDTPDLWDSLLDLPHGHLSTWKQGVKAGNLAGKRASLSLRFAVRHLLGAIVLDRAIIIRTTVRSPREGISLAMKAIVITGVGGPEVLELREVSTPEPRGDQ